MAVERVEEGDALAMQCDLCGARAPFDDALPCINQTASFATDHGCPDATGSVMADNVDESRLREHG
jgi:hypothetical protein